MHKIWRFLSFGEKDSSPVAPTSLAPEIWDYIIDYLHDDKSTLFTCALVHRAWTDTARHHLFRQITLYLDLNAGKVLDRFSSLIIPGAVVPHVRKLRIVAEEDAHQNFSSAAQWLSVDLLPNFLFVHGMALYYTSPAEHVSPMILHWIKDQMQYLDTLTLRLHVKNIEQALALIAFAPSLKRLSVSDFQQYEAINQYQATQVFSGHTPAPLNHLTISFTPIGHNPQLQLIRWMESHPREQSIQTFRASDLTMDSLLTFQAYMDTLGSGVEHLALRPHAPYFGTFTPNIDLSGTTSLRSISIMIRAGDFLERACDILSNIPSQLLKEVIFEIHFTASQYVALRSFMIPARGVETFRVLDEYFADESPKYPAQSAAVRFTLSYMGSHRPESDGQLIKPLLPRTHALGRLQVDVVGESDVIWFEE